MKKRKYIIWAVLTVILISGAAVWLLFGALAWVPECTKISLPEGRSLMENVQRRTLLGSKDGVTTHSFEKSGYTSDTHCAFSFLRFADDEFTKPKLPDEVQ